MVSEKGKQIAASGSEHSFNYGLGGGDWILQSSALFSLTMVQWGGEGAWEDFTLLCPNSVHLSETILAYGKSNIKILKNKI